MTLSLLKIEEGLCEGTTLYHSYSKGCADEETRPQDVPPRPRAPLAGGGGHLPRPCR